MRTQLINSPFGRLPNGLNLLGRMIWIAILILPWAWWYSTTDVTTYWQYGAPPGQVWYVLSKLFGLYAAVLLWLQALCGLLKPTPYAAWLPSWARARHGILGAISVLVVTAHIGSFVMAVSLRKNSIEWPLLLPNVKDFYHASITVGLTAFFLLLLAATAAGLRNRIGPIWRRVHRLMPGVIALGLLHGFLIGTETRYGFYTVFYSALALTFILALVARWRTARVIKRALS
ncbi:hypothetical protein [Saccharospirillum salsuginis]|uniref:Ferric oxidoreductase domain-containing protein n=1 Tax=Saccharospirillum salsuginis TaxID=418750 RepID=A0A918NGL2_9GAMM|nr:hypothetical protein [Saccharospirillum salsuginis]GGX65960.1 hypothetical protein GCM10007392_36970 [Saccharospirillum salsuginis]